MLGLIGFLVAALTFSLYGYSVQKYKTKKISFDLDYYSSAFALTAVGCVVWALGTQSSGSALEKYVLIGDLFLLAATTVLVWVLTKKIPYMIGALLVSAGALLYRAQVDFAQPVIRDSVLVFNTPRVFGTILLLAVLFVWLPVNMKFYSLYIRSKVTQDLLRPTYYTVNLISLVGLAGFLLARKQLTITMSFTTIIFGYLVLALLNITVRTQLAKSTKGVHHGK